jgi:hypothetical protein
MSEMGNKSDIKVSAEEGSSVFDMATSYLTSPMFPYS